MKKGTITLRPIGGLGNRILAVASSMALAHETDKDLIVIWERDEMLNCSFHQLFIPIPGVKVIERYIQNPFLRVVKRHLSHLFYQKVIYYTTTHKFPLKESILSEVKSHESILVYGANQFYHIFEIGKYFIPCTNIKERVAFICKKLNSKTIGVHIRRTDHQPSVNKSPTQSFITAMKEEIRNDSETLIFLATDDPSEEIKLKKNFGSCILTYDKQLNRNSELGIQDALVDLLCLANCNKIYGSYYSSFSYTAAQYKGIKLHILNSDTQ